MKTEGPGTGTWGPWREGWMAEGRAADPQGDRPQSGPLGFLSGGSTVQGPQGPVWGDAEQGLQGLGSVRTPRFSHPWLRLRVPPSPQTGDPSQNEMVLKKFLERKGSVFCARVHGLQSACLHSNVTVTVVCRILQTVLLPDPAVRWGPSGASALGKTAWPHLPGVASWESLRHGDGPRPKPDGRRPCSPPPASGLPREGLHLLGAVDKADGDGGASLGGEVASPERACALGCTPACARWGAGNPPVSSQGQAPLLELHLPLRRSSSCFFPRP